MFILTVGLILALNGQAQSPNQAAQRGDLRTWYQAYDAGVAAFNKRDWQAAIASLEVARQKNQTSGRKVLTTGNTFIDYLPDYYLGQAYYNLNQYAQAHDAFNRVKQSNVIRRTDKEYATFNDTAAKTGAALFDQQTSDALALLAAGKISEASAKYAEAVKNAYADAKRLTDLGGRIAAANVSGNTGQPATTGSTNPAAAGRANQLPNQRNAPPNPRQNQVPPPLSPTVPPDFGLALAGDEPAIVAFFSGKYQEARDSLASRMQGPSATPRTSLYLACSEAALVLIGRADPVTLTEARNLYANAVRSYAVDEDLKLISPKILDLLRAK